MAGLCKDLRMKGQGGWGGCCLPLPCLGQTSNLLIINSYPANAIGTAQFLCWFVLLGQDITR